MVQGRVSAFTIAGSGLKVWGVGVTRVQRHVACEAHRDVPGLLDGRAVKGDARRFRDERTHLVSSFSRLNAFRVWGLECTSIVFWGWGFTFRASCFVF